MQFKCSICQKSFDEICLLYICYVCNIVICENHKHSHDCSIDKSDYDDLKEIIKRKMNAHTNAITDLLNVDIVGYPLNVSISDINFDKVEETRNILKPFRYTNMELNIDYKRFFDKMIQLKTKFLYNMYKIYLKNRFCSDITFYILTYI